MELIGIPVVEVSSKSLVNFLHYAEGYFSEVQLTGNSAADVPKLRLHGIGHFAVHNLEDAHSTSLSRASMRGQIVETERTGEIFFRPPSRFQRLLHYLGKDPSIRVTLLPDPTD